MIESPHATRLGLPAQAEHAVVCAYLIEVSPGPSLEVPLVAALVWRASSSRLLRLGHAAALLCENHQVQACDPASAPPSSRYDSSLGPAYRQIHQRITAQRLPTAAWAVDVSQEAEEVLVM